MPNIRSFDYTTEKEKNMKNQEKKSAQIFCHHCDPGMGDSKQNLFAGGCTEIDHVHEPQKASITMHNA